jgi:hypothetical protein
MVAAMRGLLITLGLLVGAGSAAAQSASADKENWIAQLTSLGATWGTVTVGFAIAGDDAEGTRGDIGVSLVLAGLTLGPTAGHWYVGDQLITTGMLLRLGSFAAIPAILIFDPYWDRPSFSGPVIGVASLAFVTGMIWDHATLPSAVRRHNREPAVMPIVTGHGIALAGRF